MQPYLKKTLIQFDNLTPSKKKDVLYPHTPLRFGATEQFAKYDTSAPVGKGEQKYIQKVNGKFLWYAQGINRTLLTALSTFATQQSKQTTQTMA